MTYTKASPEWQEIISNNPMWFKGDTIKFWNSTILWDTLEPVGDGDYLFISLEDNFTRTTQLYSVRLARAGGGIDSLAWQYSDDLTLTKNRLGDFSFHLGSRC
jgi:hypothetical protein